MAATQPEPHQRQSIAAVAAALLLATWCVSPAVNAAPSVSPQCDDVSDASLDIPAREFSAEIVSHDTVTEADNAPAEASQQALSPALYLVPRAKSDARDAFQERAAPVADVVPPASKEVPVPETSGAEDLPSINTRIPGVSADDLARYRRQMYRNDI